MIDELYSAPDNDPAMQKILSYIHENAASFEYSDTEPTEVPFGKFVIYDSGTEKKIFFKTGKNSVGSVGGIPSGGIIMWSGAIADIPGGWYLCNGSNGTPDLRNLFIVGADADDGGVAKSTVTGAALQTSTAGVMPAHTHTYIKSPGASSVGPDAGGDGSQTLDTENTGSTGTGTKVIAVFYALAFIMKA